MAKIAESKAARTATVPELNGDKFLWGDFAAKFHAFQTAVEAQEVGYQGPDFWVRTLVNRWVGKLPQTRS